MDRSVSHLRETIESLDRWGRERNWIGPDPYEGLNARRGRALWRTPFARRLLIQAVKRSPLDLRPALGIAPEVDAATLAHVLRARVRLAGGGDDAPTRAALLPEAERLLATQCRSYEGTCWGYHFDVETRFFFYGRGTPNTIATAFAGHALIDSYLATGERSLLDAVDGVARFFLDEISLTEAPGGGFFGYFPGDRTPIHNASLLAASVLARRAAVGGGDTPGRPPAEAHGQDELRAAVESAVGFALLHQRADGSWPYAEGPKGSWVDGFHTGYVLDALAEIGATGAAGAATSEIAGSLARGLAYYRNELILGDGTPRNLAGSTFPIDGQNAAQAIRTLALAARTDHEALGLAWRVYEFAVERLLRRDGSFVFQRHRLFVNRIAYPRWVEAPMLEALTLLLEVADSAESGQR